MDKEFINENKFSADVERFKQIAEYKSPKQSKKNLYEYTFFGSPLVNEEGEDENNPQQGQPQGGGGMDMQGGSQPPMDGQQQQMGQDMNGGMPPMGGNMPQDNGMQPPMGDMSQQPQMGGMQPPMDGQQAPMGGDMQEPPMDDGQQPQMGDMPPADDTGEDIETQEMDDEVIDVDDLTKSQEATEYKIDGVDDRLSKIYAVVQKFSDQLEKNEKSIMALKDEFEKRNPTEQEKLNIRSQSSYPYSEMPKDYWEKKAMENPHYSIMSDNDVSPSNEQEEFEIKKGDIDGLNMKDISDTLDINQNLKNYLNF